MSTLSRTVGRREAAVERTGTYLQRVLESVLTSCFEQVSLKQEQIVTA